MQVFVTISIGVVVGVAVGAVHFGGLAWTVRLFVGGRHPGIVALSYVVRMGVTAAAVVVVAVVAPIAALGVVPGVIVARTVLTSRARDDLGIAATPLVGPGDG